MRGAQIGSKPKTMKGGDTYTRGLMNTRSKEGTATFVLSNRTRTDISVGSTETDVMVLP